MPEHNYANHWRTAPLYHFGLPPLLLAAFTGSLVHVTRSASDHERVVFRISP